MYSNWALNIKGLSIDNRLIECVHLCSFLNDKGNTFAMKTKPRLIILYHVGDVTVMVYIDRKIE